MKHIPRRTAWWWGLVAAGAAGLLPACDGDTSGPGGTGGSGGSGASTSSETGGGGAGGTGGATGGSGGTGGAGGATGKPDGDPCTTNEECENGFCLTQAQFGFPYGYCTGACNSFIPCPEGSTCSQVANNPFCLKNCTTTADCKEGKVCSDLGLGSSVCVAYCTANEQCAGYGTCNLGTGACTPAEDCSLPGDEDQDALINCEDGQCVTTAECAPLIAAACGAAVPIEVTPGVPVVTMGDTTGQTSLFGSYCGGGGEGEDIYTLTVPAGVTGILEFTLAGAGQDVALYVRDECENDLSSQCIDDWGDGEPELVRESASPGKTVWVFADGSYFGSGNSGPYSLTTTLYQAQPESEPNDVGPPPGTSTADPVDVTTSHVLVSAALDKATDDDDWFSIDTTALGNKTLRAETIGYGGAGCAPFAGDIDTYIEVVAADGTLLADGEDINSATNHCSLVELVELPPALYYLHVKTSDLCVVDPNGPDCKFPYGIKITVEDP